MTKSGTAHATVPDEKNATAKYGDILTLHAHIYSGGIESIACALTKSLRSASKASI